MGLIQRIIEARGIPTTSVSINKTFTEQVRPPRAVHVKWPFGHAFGEPGNLDQQRTMVRLALSLLLTAEEPGTLVEPGYRWRRQDYAGLPESISLE